MDRSDPLMGLKRKCSSLSQTKNFKRARLDESRINIQQLSDCTLLNLLQYLDSTSLYHLGLTCTRFNRLVRDESLWIYVEARHKPNNIDKADYCWDNVTKKTRTILTAGESRSEVLLSLDKLIFNSPLENLTVLALENQCIKYCKLKDFPRTLQELSFRKSFIAQQDSFFRFSHETMSNLKVLIFDHCQWLSPNCFVSVSRFPNLEIASFYMCKKLGDDDMSTVSVTGILGFPKIKVFDLRFTDIGDTFIRTFYRNLSLQVIYMQNYTVTYYKERKERMEGIGRGQKFREHCYVSDDEDNDLSSKSIEKRFGAANLQKYSSNSISDNTMSVFQACYSTGENVARPKSTLYVYPYRECTCGFNSRQLQDDYEEENSEDLSDLSSDDESYDSKSKCKGLYYLIPDNTHVCSRITFDSCLGPEWCYEQSTPQCYKHRWLFAREPRNDHEIDMLEHTDKHFKARIAIKACSDTVQTYGEPNCVCCSRHENQVLIFSSSPDRGYQVQPDYQPIVPSSVKEVSDRSILILIGKIANIIERIKTSTHPDSEVLYIIKQILDSLKIEFDSSYYSDSTFICKLRVALTELVKNVRHKIVYILRYHFNCFELLLSHLQYNDALTDRKEILTSFFNNLMRSEVNPYLSNSHCKNKKEKWNVPGTSSGEVPVSDCMDKTVIKTSDNTSSQFSSGSSYVDSMTMYVIRRNIYVNDQDLQQELPPMRHNLRNLIIQLHDARYDSNIKELSLRGYQGVTNATLSYLKNLELELLDLTGTNVTISGIRDFLQTNPLCRVIHKCACVCKPSLHF